MNQAESSINKEVLNRLSQLLQGGRFPHALILEGGAGQEKTEAALFLARAAVCTGEPKPCGRCPGCRKALASSHPDIYVAGGGTAARSFHVEAIRFIRSDAYIKPNEAPRKVYVLLEAQTMSEQAQNVLLKILEEPPENVLFLLTVPSASALLATVRSRSQLLALEAPQQAHADAALVNAVVDGLCAPGECELLFSTAPLVRDKETLRLLLADLILLFRDAGIRRAGGPGCLSGQPEAAARLASSFSRDRLMALLETAQAAVRWQSQNANAALLVTALCSKLRAAAGK